MIVIDSCGRRPEKSTAEETVFYNPAHPLFIPVISNISPVKALMTVGTQLVVARYRTQTNRGGVEEWVFTTPEEAPWTNSQTGTVQLNQLWGAVRVWPLVIDTLPPEIRILATSPFIKPGGSAVVRFDANDAGIGRCRVKTTGGSFTALRRPDDSWMAVLAWPVDEPDFQARIIARDQAGNENSMGLPLEKKKYQYPVSRLQVKGHFDDDKLKEFGETNQVKGDKTRYDSIMQEFNKRKTFSAVDWSWARATADTNRMEWQPFRPLLSYRRSSPFGQKRQFVLKNEVVRESYHLGLDMGGVNRAPIRSVMPGKVVYTGYNGANGNMVFVDHGAGVYTLYAHCSEIRVKEGQRVRTGHILALTGNTGYSLGEHLHFSVLVQGRFVDPDEWMNHRWIKRSVQLPLEESFSAQD